MKLKDCFVSHTTGKQQILVSTDTKIFSGLVKSNETAAFIIHLLEKETTKEDILCEMKKQYRGEEVLMSEDIDKVLGVLSEIGALDDNACA